MKNNHKSQWTNFLGNIFFPILIFLICIPVLLDLFHPGLPITHDGQDHVARIANFYQNLQEGVIIPRWAGNLNWGYGHPILMFLYPLPSYVASLFYFLGFTLVDSTKLVFGAMYIASGLTMYLWMKEFLGKGAGFASAVFYLFAPYRFIDLYVRGAIGEHVAFVFPPLICYFLLRLSKQESSLALVGGTLSLAALILSHNAISLMFLPLIILYAMFPFFTIKNKNKKTLLINYAFILIVGFGIAAFFWLPAYFEGKYTLRDIVTAGDITSRFVSIPSFLYGSWNYGGTGEFSTQIGIIHWIIVLVSVIALLVYKRQDKKLFLFGLSVFTIFFLSLFLMTSFSNFIWNTIATLKKFQFPWRFLSVSVFTVATLAGFTISLFTKKQQLLFCIAAGLLLLFANQNFWHARDYLSKPENFYSGIYNSTTDTGESSPIWSVRFMEHIPKAHMEVITGESAIQERGRTFTKHEYIVNASEQTRIRENTLFFPGWQVFVDGKKITPEFQDPANRGIMTFFINKGKHDVLVKFEETKLRFIANCLSLVSLTMLFIWVIVLKKRKI